MHLWPSMKLRDSFKLDYLNNLEWNLRRLKNKKNQSSGSSNQESLLCDDDQNSCSKDRCCGCASAVLKDLLMICSCWCCCYCWGACID